MRDLNAAKEARENRFDELLSVAQVAVQNLEQPALALERIVTQLFGAVEPVPCEESKATPDAPGTFAEMERTLQTLQYLTVRLSDSVRRFGQ